MRLFNSKVTRASKLCTAKHQPACQQQQAPEHNHLCFNLCELFHWWSMPGWNGLMFVALQT